MFFIYIYINKFLFNSVTMPSKKTAPKRKSAAVEGANEPKKVKGNI